MKIKRLTIVLFFIFIRFCFGQWYEIKSFTSNTLFDIYFVDQQTGWTNGASKLYMTNNYGESWEQILEENYIGNVYSTEPNKLFICTTGGLSSSTDYGASWTFTNFNYSGISIRDIDFVNKNNGWVCSDYLLFYTKDGGNNWNESGTFPQTGMFWADLFSLSFIDTLSGWLVRSNGDIFSTKDGGISWTKKGNSGLYGLSNNNGIFFADSLNGFVIDFFGITKTTDGGISWNKIESSQEKEINCFYFINKKVGWIGGQKGLFRTKDGGEHWLLQYFGKSVQSLHFINEDIGWASGNDGLLLYTYNGGGDSVFVGIKNELLQQESYKLDKNYPNPFNPTTTIKYSIPKAGFVTIKVYDILGREIAVLVNEYKQIGSYEIKFNGSQLSSGVYLYRITSGNFIETRKMVLSK